jgi:hypothetical protein
MAWPRMEVRRMKSFAQFLLEAPEFKPLMQYYFNQRTQRSEQKQRGHRHDFNVGKHKVSVYYHHDKMFEHDTRNVYPNYPHQGPPRREVSPKRHHIGVTFEVNGSLDRRGKRNISMEDKHKIAHHVAHSVRTYVKQHSPTHVSASGNTDKKSKLYDKFWKHIAKTNRDYKPAKYGGGIVHKSHWDWHGLNESWSILHSKDSQGGDRHLMYKDHQVGPHKVRVLFSHNGGKNYNVDYSVNRQFNGHGQKMNVEPEHQHAILHHVHKTIDRFIRHRKPTGINMATVETKKHHLYRMFGKRIMKAHGGVMHSRDHHEGGLVMMKFPHNIKKKE